MVSFMSQPFYPWGKYPQYPLGGRLGGPQSQFGCGGKEKSPSMLLPGIKPWSSSQ